MFYQFTKQWALDFDRYNYILMEQQHGKQKYYYYATLEGLLKSLAEKLPRSELNRIKIDPANLLEKLTDGYKQIVELVLKNPNIVEFQQYVDCQRELQQCKKELQKLRSRTQVSNKKSIKRVYSVPDESLVLN